LKIGVGVRVGEDRTFVGVRGAGVLRGFTTEVIVGIKGVKVIVGSIKVMDGVCGDSPGLQAHNPDRLITMNNTTRIIFIKTPGGIIK